MKILSFENESMARWPFASVRQRAKEYTSHAYVYALGIAVFTTAAASTV